MTPGTGGFGQQGWHGATRTVIAMPAILHGLAKRRLRPVTLTELLAT
jgi:hypothetical protein